MVEHIGNVTIEYNEKNWVSDKDNYPPINEAGKEEMEAVSQWIKKRGLIL